MYYVGLDVHKKTISYCVKDTSGRVHQEGKIGAKVWIACTSVTEVPTGVQIENSKRLAIRPDRFEPVA